MSWFENLSLVKKLCGLVGMLLVFLVIVGAQSVSQIGTVGAKGSDIYASNTTWLDQLGSANTAFADEQVVLLKGIIGAGDAAAQNSVDAALASDRAQFTKQINAFAAPGISPDESAAVKAIRGALSTFVAQQDRIRSLSKAGDAAAARALVNQAAQNVTGIQTSLNTLISINQHEAADAAKSIKSTTSSSRTLTIVLIAIAALLGAGFAFVTIRQIVATVRKILTRANALQGRCARTSFPGWRRSRTAISRASCSP